MERINDSLNRFALPSDENNIISSVPSVKPTSTNVSFSLSSIARMPFALGLENCSNDVFLTVPLVVAIKTNISSVYSLIGSKALIFSPSDKGKTLIIGRPFDPLLARGSSYTFFQ